MPRLAAEHVLRKAHHLQPFERWSPGLADFLCRTQGVRTIQFFKYLRQLGSPLREADFESDWDAYTLLTGDRPLIVYRTIKSVERMTFSIIHELGHVVLGHPGSDVDLVSGAFDEAPQWCEDEADQFAAHVLLPMAEMRWLKRRRTSPWDIARQKGVSFGAVRQRLQEMAREGQFDEWTAMA